MEHYPIRADFLMEMSDGKDKEAHDVLYCTVEERGRPCYMSNALSVAWT